MFPTQVAADDCSWLPLTLSVAGAMTKKQPPDASSWRAVHDTLEKKLKEMRSEEMTSRSKSIFSIIDASVEDLPTTVRQQLHLMVVLASGVAANSEMLASLWNVVRNYQYMFACCVGLYGSPLGLPSWSTAANNPAACALVVQPHREKSSMIFETSR